ncbi:resolvase [Escherichia coli]|nr:resolvase [Salmonella enterica subsp. enterica]MBK3310429.1 resolvase [Klebsiella pneumoniae]PSG15962.1 resolvase [Escherichia coli]
MRQKAASSLTLQQCRIEHSRDWCRSLLILNCQELAAQQPLRPINWCSRLLKMTIQLGYSST